MGLLFSKRRELSGKRVLLTGASSGIGRELAKQLAAANARQVLLARSEDTLHELRSELGEQACEVVAGDVTDHSARAAALQRATDAYGGLDLLINNAGAGAYGRFTEVSSERLRTLMEVNLFAPAELIREAAPLLAAGEDSAVVNIGSILGCRGLPFSSEYCASKFALHGLSEA
ncbi:MAG: SDR family NAD(P)-dependent oxidoreductase, partial [Planctomycetota bacterium]